MLDPECVRYQASVDGSRWVKQNRAWGVDDSRVKGEGRGQKPRESPGGRFPLDGLQPSERVGAGRQLHDADGDFNVGGFLAKKHDLTAVIGWRVMAKSPMPG